MYSTIISITPFPKYKEINFGILLPPVHGCSSCSVDGHGGNSGTVWHVSNSNRNSNVHREPRQIVKMWMKKSGQRRPDTYYIQFSTLILTQGTELNVVSIWTLLTTLPNWACHQPWMISLLSHCYISLLLWSSEIVYCLFHCYCVIILCIIFIYNRVITFQMSLWYRVLVI